VPASMKAIVAPQPDGAEELALVERPVPRTGTGEVLIEVAAAGVNRPDILQRRGLYPPPPGAPDTLGLEVAGRVVETGAGAEALLGRKMCALVAGGGYAEYCAAPEGQCLPAPDALSTVEAACVPETFFTVWTNVFQRGRLGIGETLLVHGGSSGIGTTAIQLAKAFGAKVFATAGSAEKCQACEKLGADRAINYREADFVAVIQDETGGRGVDVVLDMVGGDYVARSLKIMATGGRHVSIAFLRGARIELNLEPLMRKRLTLTGSTLRPRSVAEKSAIAAELREKVWPLLNSGRIRPVMFKTFPLAQAAAAHALMESSEHIGKIALAIRNEGA
jgi:NADPH:quinone reductase